MKYPLVAVPRGFCILRFFPPRDIMRQTLSGEKDEKDGRAGKCFPQRTQRQNRGALSPALSCVRSRGLGERPERAHLLRRGRRTFFANTIPIIPIGRACIGGISSRRDLIRWEFLPVALAPDQNYDCGGGCFSGTALEHEGKARSDVHGRCKRDVQQQCLAVSEDGVTFEKAASNPVIPASLLPEGCSGRDFRDPKVFARREGIFYCITGVRDGEDGRSASLPLARSASMVVRGGGCSRPREDGIIVDGVCECPDYFEADGKELLLFCAMNYPEREGRFQNVHSSLYMTGRLGLSSGRFEPETCGELDGGFDFYAPQTMRLPDGRRVLIAWKQTWGRTIPTAEDGWAGSFTLPRELRVIDGMRSIRRPSKRSNVTAAARFLITISRSATSAGSLPASRGRCLNLKPSFSLGSAKRAGVVLFQGENHETLVFYDAEAGRVVFDRSQLGRRPEREAKTSRTCASCPFPSRTASISFRIFLDVSSAEVFLNGGKGVMTGNIYADEGDTGHLLLCGGR